MWITIALGIGQSGTGSNAIVNYATFIFKSADDPKSGVLGGIILSFAFFIFAAVLLPFVYKVKRRVLLAVGLTGIIGSLIVLIGNEFLL